MKHYTFYLRILFYIKRLCIWENNLRFLSQKQPTSKGMICDLTEVNGGGGNCQRDVNGTYTCNCVIRRIRGISLQASLQHLIFSWIDEIA